MRTVYGQSFGDVRPERRPKVQASSANSQAKGQRLRRLISFLLSCALAQLKIFLEDNNGQIYSNSQVDQ